MALRLCHWAAGTLLLVVAAAGQAQTAAPAQPWTVETIPLRSSADGAEVTLALALRAPADRPARHVVLYLSPNSAQVLKVSRGSSALGLAGPWVRTSALLNERGIAVAFADAPSDARARSIRARSPGDVRQELQAALDYLRERFAGTPVHLASFANGAAPTLDAAEHLEGVSRIAIASGNFLDSRESDWTGLATPVMLVHAPGALCEVAPFLEAEIVARQNRFTLVVAGYEKPETRPDCGRGSQHVLARLDAEFAETVLRWLEGKSVTGGIGHAHPQVAWREQAVTFPAPGIFGVNQLEMTLMLPEGAGPFPIAVFNHGDVSVDDPSVRYRRRVRSTTVAWEFLRQGVAVAVPARRGIGLSEGVYPGGFGRYDSDPTYKARFHAQDILAALDYLRSRPELDSKRIILAGQSAGGYSVMYVASTNPPGVIGVVGFSSGRTDATALEGPAYLHRTMVNGYEELGRTSRIPTLWIFAENDSKYTAHTIRSSHEAYVKAGGKAKLVLHPPIPGDGHFIYNRPNTWRQPLQDYLREIGVLKPEASQVTRSDGPARPRAP